MSQADFFNINPNPEESKKETLAEKFTKERSEWQEKIALMSSHMKNINKISELMLSVYTERQICLDYYHYLISKSIIVNREYRKRYAERHEFWTWKSNVRYPNETSKNNKILVELADIQEKRESIDNHARYIAETMKTIDNIIYAIPRRIEIEQISRGK